MKHIQTSWQKHDGAAECPVSPDAVVEIETYTPYVSGTYKALAVNWDCVKFFRVVGIESMDDEMPNDVQDIQETGNEQEYSVFNDDNIKDLLVSDATNLIHKHYKQWSETGSKDDLALVMKLAGLLLIVDPQ